MTLTKVAVRLVSAFIGFAVTFAMMVVVLTICMMVSHSLSGYRGPPSPGAIGQIFIAASMGLSVYGARLGWDLSRKWLP